MSAPTDTSRNRTFLRSVEAPGTYDLNALRQEQRDLPRVWTGGWDSPDSRPGYGESAKTKQTKGRWYVSPEDEPFRTQTLQVHSVAIQPGGKNSGHAHQNEAAFYIIEGRGYEIHDGERYEWKQGDVVVVHTDSVHQHYNLSDTERAVTLVFKAKATWMHLGLYQQGMVGRKPEPEDAYGPRVDWSQLWTPGVEERRKVLRGEDIEWELTPDGWIRRYADRSNDARLFSVDMYEQWIPTSSRSARHWHMADEVLYVLEGSGKSLQWDVEPEFDDKYYARIAKEPSTWEFSQGDFIYVPANTVHQFLATGDADVRLLSAQNRLIKHLGYDNVAYLENAPEYDKPDGDRRPPNGAADSRFD